MSEIDSDSNWSTINAMSRSHAWRHTRGVEANRTCNACGDDFDSSVRYCPGGSVTSVEHVTLPGLENETLLRGGVTM